MKSGATRLSPRPRSRGSTRTWRSSIRRSRSPSCPPLMTRRRPMDRPRRSSGRFAQVRGVTSRRLPRHRDGWSGIEQRLLRRRRVCVARRAGRLASQRARRRADAGSADAWSSRICLSIPTSSRESPTARPSGWAPSPSPPSAAGRGPSPAGARRGNVLSLFRESVAFMDCANWATGQVGRVTVSLNSPVRRLYTHVVAGQFQSVANARLFSSSPCSACCCWWCRAPRCPGASLWRDRSPQRCTSSSRAPSARARATSATGSTSPRGTSSATWRRPTT